MKYILAALLLLSTVAYTQSAKLTSPRLVRSSTDSACYNIYTISSTNVSNGTVLSWNVTLVASKGFYAKITTSQSPFSPLEKVMIPYTSNSGEEVEYITFYYSFISNWNFTVGQEVSLVSFCLSAIDCVSSVHLLENHEEIPPDYNITTYIGLHTPSNGDFLNMYEDNLVGRILPCATDYELRTRFLGGKVVPPPPFSSSPCG
jgi:hypothetical protein